MPVSADDSNGGENATVTSGDKLTLICAFDSLNESFAWYKDGEPFRVTNPRVRLQRQRIRFKMTKPEDSGNYACLVDHTEWRHLELRVEPELNNIFPVEGVSDELGKILGAVRPDDETNELELGDPRGTY
jgi:hypothetical protein